MTIIEMRDKRAKLLATMDGFLDTHRNDKGVLSAEDDATYYRNSHYNKESYNHKALSLIYIQFFVHMYLMICK